MTSITVINPNTSRAMTDAIGRAAREVAAPGTAVTAVNPDMGPASVESHYDAALAVPGLLTEVTRASRADPPADGFVVACFGDPGLDAAREVASVPVVGIAEAALTVATLLGRTFSVVTTLPRTVGLTRELLVRYGRERACAGVHACDIPVLELDDPSARATILERGARALAEDGCDVIVLGCAGMADLPAVMSAELGVPVVDGVAAATKLVEGLVAQGLTTSTRGEHASPPPKPQSGLLTGFTLK